MNARSRPAGRAFLARALSGAFVAHAAAEAKVDGIVIQPLRLIAPDNTVQVALYALQKLPGGGRINGCRLVPSIVQAA